MQITKNYLDVVSLLVIAIIAIVFSYWFAFMQVSAVYVQAMQSYPKFYFIVTILKCSMTIFAIFLLCTWTLAIVSHKKVSPRTIAFSFLPLFAVFINVSLLTISAAILALQLLSLLVILNREDYRRISQHYLLDILVLALFVILHIVLTTRFSPFNFNIALLAGDGYYTEELPVLAPIFRGYVLAKQFAFSYIDHSAWAGIMNPPITLASPLLQLLTFIFDLPSISYQHFHIILMAIHLILMILGSFGFYLFLKYAMKLQFLICVFGGYLFFFSGAPMLGQMFIADGGVFLSPYAIFPYALLFIVLAFEKNQLIYSVCAGLALASQLFFYTPHPEGVIYSLLFFSVFSGFLVICTHDLPKTRQLKLVSMALLLFFVLSAYTIVPIMYDRLMGNMFVFAHTGDIRSTPLENLKLYALIFAAVLPVCLFAELLKEKSSPMFLSCLYFTVFLIALLLLTSNTTFINFLVRVFHVGLHFWYPWRIGMYFSMAVFIIALYALQILSNIIFSMIHVKSAKLSMENAS